jgi:hypothetical protein
MTGHIIVDFFPNPTWAWNTAAVAEPCKIQTGLADRIPRFKVPKTRYGEVSLPDAAAFPV